MDAILKAAGLKKYYGKGEALVKALDGVDLEIERGKFTAIIGTSGSGKSTLLNMLGGLDTPTEGSIRIGDTELAELDSEAATIFRRKQIGFIFQNYNLVPVLSVWENIILPISLDGRRPDKKFIMEIVKLLGLAKKLDNLPNNLSGGQQQRVAIARALATNPEIIYFDEPTSALDPELTGEVLSVMRQLADEGMTMLVVTHEMSFARNVSNQVIFMENGVVVESGPSREFFTSPRQERTRAFLRTLSGEM